MKFKTLLVCVFFLLLGCSDVKVDKAKNAVSSWIRKYALYPESYEPVSFPDYEVLVSSKGLNETGRVYVIRHIHKIRNQEGIITKVDAYFMVEEDNYIGLIEFERSNSLGAPFPPETKVWMEKFGRQLNQSDSAELEARKKIVMKKVTRELIEGVENGDAIFENAEDEEMVRKLIDTLKNEE